MKSDEQLQKEVLEAIKWKPLLHAAEIGVTAKEGIVTLSGTVDNYLKKIEAENAAKHVAGVKAIVEKIEVKFSRSLIRSDQEIAEAVANKLAESGYLPEELVKVKIENGKVWLSGNVSLYYQRSGAATAIRGIPGIKGIFNLIKIKNEVQDTIDKYKILDALHRDSLIDGENIVVVVENGEVTLKGKVRSLFEKEEVERAIHKTPGIGHIDNQLLVDY